MRPAESILQEQVCSWLRLQYPDILFHSDYGSGLKMNMANAILQKRLQKVRAWPDLFIAEPRGHYAGLFIELKKLTSSELLRSGEVGNTAHIREQREVLEMLEGRGYKAVFSVGFDNTIELIKNYLILTSPKSLNEQ